jgi:hypothetical protein
MKTINRQKLEAMGLKKVQAACLVHAQAAIDALAVGNEQQFQRSCDLLDQCAIIGRRLKGHTTPPRRDAREAVLDAA